LTIADTAVLATGAFGGNELVFWWADGASDDQEAIDFTLSIVAVDHAGNESAPKTVRVVAEGRGGCAVASRTHRRDVVAFPLLALATLAARRRDARP
jgi:MYXO-CTERM domain-containing protein